MSEKELNEMLTTEFSKLVGYSMPFFEELGLRAESRQNLKKIFWLTKDNLLKELTAKILEKNEQI